MEVISTVSKWPGHTAALPVTVEYMRQGRGRIISHDFNDGVWRVRWKVIAILSDSPTFSGFAQVWSGMPG